MCIIGVKRKADDLPLKSTLRQCFTSNPDGAGFMYLADDGIKILKGFMTFKSFWKAYQREDLGIDSTIIFHFRITTAGGTKPKNCHPFPLSTELDELEKLRSTVPVAMVHNGIISNDVEIEGISDTMEYILETIGHPHVKDNIHEVGIHNLMLRSIEGSRVCVLREDGYMLRLGSWEKDKSTGMLFSNSTFEVPRWTRGSYYGHGEQSYLGQWDKYGKCYGCGTYGNKEGFVMFYEDEVCQTCFKEYTDVQTEDEDVIILDLESEADRVSIGEAPEDNCYLCLECEEELWGGYLNRRWDSLREQEIYCCCYCKGEVVELGISDDDITVAMAKLG